MEDKKRDPKRIKRKLSDQLTDTPLDVHHPFPKREKETLRRLMLLDEDVNRKGIVRSIEDLRNDLIKEQNILVNRPAKNRRRLEQINAQMKRFRAQLRKTPYGGFLGFPVSNERGKITYIGFDKAKSLAGLKEGDKMLDKDFAKASKNQVIKILNAANSSLVNAVNKLPSSIKGEICNSSQAGGLSKTCARAIKENPNKALNIIEEKTKKLPKQTGDEVLKAAAKIRQGLKVTGLGLLGEVPFELAAGVNPYKRGKPIDEIVDQSIIGLYGVGRDLNRPGIEDFVNTTQRSGALKFYDYYKDQNRLNEIDTTLRRLSVDQPDADTSDLLQEKELIQGRLGTEPTQQDVNDFEIFLKRRAGEFEANKKARGQYGPFTNIVQGTTSQSFSDAAEELNIDLGGILSDLVLPERENIIPTTTRKQRRDRDFIKRRAEGIQRLEQNILFPATDSSFAGGGIAKQAGVESGVAPESGPNSQGLASLIKRGRKY